LLWLDIPMKSEQFFARTEAPNVPRSLTDN
jgi:hypothetical protein